MQATAQATPEGAEATHPATTVVDDISKVRQQLADRELSVMRSIIANTELLQKVADAEDLVQKLKAQIARLEEQPSPAEAVAEITRLKKEWSQTQKAQQREHGERRAELVKLRSLLHQTQKQYEDEARARRLEAAHSSATIANLQRDMGDLRVQASKSRQEHEAERKTHWKFAVAAVSAVTIVSAVVFFWPASSKLQAKTVENPVSVVQPVAARPLEMHGKLPPPVASLAAPTGREFSHSLGLLNDALGGFPGRTPEQVLREVHMRLAKDEPGVCSFQWNNGQPSLLFGAAQPNVTITSTLNRCAQAVETYRVQNNAPAPPH